MLQIICNCIWCDNNSQKRKIEADLAVKRHTTERDRDGGAGAGGGLGLSDGLASQLLSVSAFKPIIDRILAAAGSDNAATAPAKPHGTR